MLSQAKLRQQVEQVKEPRAEEPEDSQAVVEEQPQATEGATYDPFGFLDPFFGGNG